MAVSLNVGNGNRIPAWIIAAAMLGWVLLELAVTAYVIVLATRAA